MFPNLLQIAGIIDKKEAEMLISEGVRYLGFPLRLPVNKDDLTEAYAAEIISQFPANIYPVLIIYLNYANEIIEFCDQLNCRIVQLHGNIEIEEIRKLKELRPEINVFKSLVITGDNTEELENTIKNLAPYCDAFITDTFDPATGASGATGKTHDWEISRRFVQISPIPVILAGGLNEKNVREAIEFVKPAGVDSHTGVENENGRKDLNKIRLFISEAEKGFENIKKAAN